MTVTDSLTSLRRAALLSLALTALTAGCTKKDDTPAESRQVELAPAPAAQPQLADTGTAAKAPAKAAKAAPAPRPAPATRTAAAPPAAAPAAEPAITLVRKPNGIIAGGSALSATMGSRICTNTNKVGDRFTATLGTPVTGSNGATIPAGATVTLRVSQAQRGENGKEGIRLAFEPVAVEFGGSSYAIDGKAVFTEMETIRAQSTGDQVKKVAIGAAIGALAGQLIGKKTKSTVTGAAVGAAAGGAVAVGTADWNACLGAGKNVTVTLASPLTVAVVR